MLRVGELIDGLLNSITMYRLVLYVLIFYTILSFIFSTFNIITYSPLQLATSAVVITASCLFLNIFFSKLLKAPTNVESVYITALILYFLILPPTNPNDVGILILVSFLAICSKFLIAYKKKHIFNPAAFAAVFLGAIGIGSSLWWIGVPAFFPFTLVCGMLVVRKIRKFKLFLTFLAVSTAAAVFFGISKGAQIKEVVEFLYTSGPIIFFATIMLTEPSTTPPTFGKQMIYATLVGILNGSQYNVGPFYASPELALVIGNIYSYIVSSREKLLLTFESSNKIAKDTYEFVFKSQHPIHYLPGQYFEWTLPHNKADSRGVRRFFTIASSPTANSTKLGVKLAEKSSSFKKKLLTLKPGEKIMAGLLAGDFTLPKDPNKKLVFIAGGIGITPFKSMIEYLLEKKEKRSIVIFYSNKTADEIAYKDLLDTAGKSGIVPVYVLTDKENVPKGWSGEIGRINEDMIKNHVADYKHCTYYLSGPNSMVHAYKELLISMGVTDIVTDYFPGF